MSPLGAALRAEAVRRLPSSPRLLVMVDTEEEFDWAQPHSRERVGVEHMKDLWRVQQIFDRFAIKPIYVIDHPIASQERAYRQLRDWLDDGRCVVGAHLHPWVNPPVEEIHCPAHTYPGNLPPALERAKLTYLTDLIERNLGHRPVIYRAGRYGLGPETGNTLEELGYKIDSSVVPHTDFTVDEGPDFTGLSHRPFWFGRKKSVLELPVTVGWHGLWRSFGARLQPLLRSRHSERLHLPGFCSRAGLFERIRLTPEGSSLAELQRLTRAMLAAGERVFILSFHSPSVSPGNTPYVRDRAGLDRFLRVIEEYCAYFVADCGGHPASAEAIYHEIAGTDSPAHQAALAS